MRYIDFGGKVQKCKQCKWQGIGADCEIHEWFSDGADYHCPECGYRFGYVEWARTTSDLIPESRPRKLPFGFRTIRLIKKIRGWLAIISL